MNIHSFFIGPHTTLPFLVFIHLDRGAFPGVDRRVEGEEPKWEMWVEDTVWRELLQFESKNVLHLRVITQSHLNTPT